jgi:hypothetical protein
MPLPLHGRQSQTSCEADFLGISIRHSLLPRAFQARCPAPSAIRGRSASKARPKRNDLATLVLPRRSGVISRRSGPGVNDYQLCVAGDAPDLD